MHIVSRVGIGKVPPSSPLFLDVGGAVNFDTTLRVIGQTTVNALISSQLAANTLVYESRVAGDSNVLFSINRDGKMEWGLGGSNVTDINLYRSDINTLRTNGSLVIDNSLYVGDAVTDTATFTARIASNFDPSATNSFSLGQDSLRWQNLWLSVKLTSVDGLFTGDLQVNGNTIIGSANSDTLAVNARVSTTIEPSADDSFDFGSLSFRWRSMWLGSNLQVDGNTILGDTDADTLAINAKISTSLIPTANNSFDFGAPLLKWRSMWLGSNLQVDGNTILGDASTDTLELNARVSTSIEPSADNLNNLGSLSQRWASLWLGSDLQVDGNTILGDSPADTVTINAGFASPINPSVDNFYDLGTFDYRWKQIHLGPNGLVVRNDNTDTDKVGLFFDSGDAFLGSSAAVNLYVTTGTNVGVSVNTLGYVGVNALAASLTRNFNVNGTSDFSDTAYFSKLSGYGLDVTAVAGIKGSIESSNPEKQLNIGINVETETVNLGTGSLTKTVNIGTGSGKTTINIGGASDIINLNGTVSATQTIESFVSDKTFTLNVGGLSNTAQNSGIIIEEADSVFLDLSDPTWQLQNVVRYSAVDTGNLKVGSTVTITSFANPVHNGQFVVYGINTNTYIDVINPAINDSSNDLIGTGYATNPIGVASILLDSTRNSWNLQSAAYPNIFKISNNGANVELLASATGIFVDAASLSPSAANTPLGTITKPWNAILNDLTVQENTSIGNPISLTSTFNVYAKTSFNNVINSDIIPSAGFDLGLVTAPWDNLYVNNIYSNTSLTANGTVTLGQASTTDVFVQGLFNSDLVPKNSTFSIGSDLTPWNQIFVNTIAFPSFLPGSVLFVNATKKIAVDNAAFFWNEDNQRLFLGQNTGSYVLDIAKPAADAIRLRNTASSKSIALQVNATTTRLEYTDSLQLGANTYANVGNGGSTPVLELTTSQVKMLGAVSVNSVSTSAASYTVQPTDVIINVDTSVSGCSIALPSAVTKRILVIKDIGNNASATGRSIQLAPASNQYVEFNSINIPFSIERDGESITLQSDGTSRWYII